MISRRNAILGGVTAVSAAAVGYAVLRQRAPKDTAPFRIGFVGRDEINTLDPAQAGTESPISIVWNTHDRLVQIDPAGKFVPRLAESWTASSDRQEWRFRVRKNVRFQSETDAPGRLLMPADVVHSLSRAVRVPGYGRTLLVDILPGVEDVIQGKSMNISGLRVEGEEVIFSLVKPFNFLLDRLSASFLSIVPAGTPDTGPTPRGTGTYRLVSFNQSSQSVVLRRHPAAWSTVSADAPEELLVRGIASEALGAAEMRSGGLDMAEFNSSGISAMRAQAKGAFSIYEHDHTSLRLVALNYARAPFSGAVGGPLARALNLGIDRAALVRRLGAGTPFGGPAPTRPEYQFRYDPTAAKALVLSLPPDTRTLEMLVEPVDEARILSELLVQQWLEIGLSVTAVYGRADFFPQVIAGKYQMALAYYGPYVPSVEQYLWAYRKSAIPIPNAMRFEDQPFEEAFAAYVSTVGKDESALESRTLARLIERPPVVWLLKPPRLMATSRPLTIDRSAGLPDFATLHLS